MIGMIIMITGKGGNDCEVTRIKYFIININYFYIMGVYVCRLINKKDSGDRSIVSSSYI